MDYILYISELVVAFFFTKPAQSNVKQILHKFVMYPGVLPHQFWWRHVINFKLNFMFSALLLYRKSITSYIEALQIL